LFTKNGYIFVERFWGAYVPSRYTRFSWGTRC